MQIMTVKSIGMTVANIARSRNFYITVLACQAISDREVAGVAFARLYGLAKVWLQMRDLQLGKETIKRLEAVSHLHLEQPILTISSGTVGDTLAVFMIVQLQETPTIGQACRFR